MRAEKAKLILARAGYNHVDEVQAEVYMSEHGWELPSTPKPHECPAWDKEIAKRLRLTDDELFFAYQGRSPWRNQEVGM